MCRQNETHSRVHKGGRDLQDTVLLCPGNPAREIASVLPVSIDAFVAVRYVLPQEIELHTFLEIANNMSVGFSGQRAGLSRKCDDKVHDY